MPRVLLLLLLLAAVGCDGGAAAPGTPTGALAQLRVGFPPRGLVDTIEVDAVDRLPLRAAELVMPDGAAAPASSIDVVDNPRLATGQWDVGNSWKDAVTDNNVAAVTLLPQAQAGAALRSRTQLLAIASSAAIPLPDPVAYRRDWQHYHIRLIFGTPPGEVETREIPAPAPPPDSAP